MGASSKTGSQQEETRIFVSYAREDTKWLDKSNPHNLIPYLVESLRRHNVTFWFDKELKGGDVFERHIGKEIDNSQIALLIVSQYFINSEFIENKEMPRIAERARQGKMIVVPVLVEPCDWNDYPFLADRQMVPGPQPLIDYTESEAEWAKVRFQILDGLKAQVKRMSTDTQTTHVQPTTQKEKKITHPSSNPKETSSKVPPPLPQGASAEAKRYRLAADNDDAIAQFNLGVLYEKGQGVAQDYAKAAHFYRKAADQELASAQLNLGVLYDDGEGVVKNHAEAARWYRKAADQGNADAQCRLGLAFSIGWGVNKDKTEAAKWYRKAADQGHAEAQYELGSYYDLGIGVEKDKAEAAKWYRKAADQGNDRAIEWLKDETALGRLKSWAFWNLPRLS
jgi:hypothetical protein